jgi:hypothetical protein
MWWALMIECLLLQKNNFFDYNKFNHSGQELQQQQIQAHGQPQK